MTARRTPTARRTERGARRRPTRAPRWPSPPRVLAGYLSVAAVAIAYAVDGPVRVAPLTALYVPLFAAAAALCGVWTGCGRPPLTRLPQLPGRYGEEVRVCLRAAGIGGGILLGGGALLASASLAWHAGSAGRTYAQLSGPYEGRIAVFLIAVVLVPNLAVWGACYGLGVGFSIGAGSAVAPSGVHGLPRLPAFPLLAAVPDGRSWTGWAALAVPVAAGCAVAWVIGNGGWSLWRTVRAACGAAVCLGAGCAVAAAWAGGPARPRRGGRTSAPSWWLAARAPGSAGRWSSPCRARCCCAGTPRTRRTTGACRCAGPGAEPGPAPPPGPGQPARCRPRPPTPSGPAPAAEVRPVGRPSRTPVLGAGRRDRSRGPHLARAGG